MGDLRRTTPLDHLMGYGRGKPTDRVYIERFLKHHRADIRGHVLEVGGSDYMTMFDNGETARADVLHRRPGNPRATLVGDLCTGEGLPKSAFDCMILTQVIHCLPDFNAAIGNVQHTAAAPA